MKECRSFQTFLHGYSFQMRNVTHSFWIEALVCVSCVNPAISRCKAELATMMRGFLPVALLDMIEKETWAGDGLLMLENLVVKPSADEIAQNHCFLKPLVLYSPAKAWIELTKTWLVLFLWNPVWKVYPIVFAHHVSCLSLFDGTCRCHRLSLLAMPMYTSTSSWGRGCFALPPKMTVCPWLSKKESKQNVCWELCEPCGGRAPMVPTTLGSRTSSNIWLQAHCGAVRMFLGFAIISFYFAW